MWVTASFNGTNSFQLIQWLECIISEVEAGGERGEQVERLGSVERLTHSRTLRSENPSDCLATTAEVN